MPNYQTAGDLKSQLSARKVSARELCDAAIARIEALDPKINAVVERDFDRARDAASAADLALARGNGGCRSLLGIPMTVKEQFNIAGLATTWGYPKCRDWRPTADALTIERLKAAGAVILGKTNVPISLADWQSYNNIYGTTNNPWDLGRSPGGSSGGGAAALAAGYVPLELGSDIGGSLRCPASFCGVFSHKPSLDLVPGRGGGPPQTPAIPTRGDLAVIGPMARSAADLALELDVLAGPDAWAEGVGYRLALPPSRHDRLADFRILVIDYHPLCPTAASVTGAVNDLAERLGKLGCIILRSSAAMPNLAHTTRLYVELLAAAFIGPDLPPEVRQRLAREAAALSADDDSLRACRLRGILMPHNDWVMATRTRFGITARWRALFRDIDAILCPAMPTPAFPHDHSPMDERLLDVDGTAARYADQVVWATIAILNGLPATTLPIARSPEGLPIGAQLIGAFLEDRTTIALAGMIERELGCVFTPPPGY
jgi:amidase